MGPIVEKKVLPVETDAEKLVNYVCGSNIYVKGEDIKVWVFTSLILDQMKIYLLNFSWSPILSIPIGCGHYILAPRNPFLNWTRIQKSTGDEWGKKGSEGIIF